MDLDKIIAELKRERKKIRRAITALLEGAGLNVKGPTRKVTRQEAKQHYPGRATPLVADDETTLGKTAVEEVVPQDYSAKETWATHARRQKEAVRSDEKALGGKEGKSFLAGSTAPDFTTQVHDRADTPNSFSDLASPRLTFASRSRFRF